MKADIHPAYAETTVTCRCGSTFTTRSTAKNGVIHADVCSQCHPFYTGKQKILDTGGRVAKWESRYGTRPRRPPPTSSFTPGRRPGVDRVSPPSRGRPPTGARTFFPATGSPLMFESCVELVDEYTDVEQQLANPDVHGDQAAARQLGRRYAQLRPVVAAYREWLAASDDLAAAREFVVDDPSFAEEVTSLEERTESGGRASSPTLLLPRDPMDDKDVIVEVKAGEGGEESALFAERPRAHVHPVRRAPRLDHADHRRGGVRPRRVQGHRHRHEGQGRPGAGRPPRIARLKFEGGVHRVQRVPVTESQGRIHTSAAGVLVLPEAEEVDVVIDANDLRIDVYRSSGPGGQSVNTTDSAVRITHLPTGVVVSCQNEKSQLQNKESAMRILRARLLAVAEEQAAKEASDVRRSQVRTVDRSERIRTYNFAENRISDHRVGFKAHNLDQVLDGDLDDVIDACVAADQAARLTEPTG